MNPIHNLTTEKDSRDLIVKDSTWRDRRSAPAIYQIAAIFVLSCGVVGWCDRACADELALLERYITDDVLAVAYVNIETLDLLPAVEFLSQNQLLRLHERHESGMVAALVQQAVGELKQRGAQRLFVLLRNSDIGFGAPMWLVTVDPEKDASALAKDFQDGLGRNLNLSEQYGVFQAVDGAVLAATNEEQIQRAQRAEQREPDQLSEPWEALGQGGFGLMVLGDRDSRRVVREMFPMLPDPFAAIDGKLIGDDLLWGGISVTLPPKADLQIVVQTSSEQTAGTVREAASHGLAILKKSVPANEVFQGGELDALLSALAPRVEGSRLVVRFEDLQNDLQRLTQLLTPPLRVAKQNAQRRSRMNQFKHLALAFHNYHSARKSFPTDSFSEEGKPLLSWRVHVLPYLEQGNLFNQFHLDEPWDSEHNRSLIEKMPEIYADPDSALGDIGRQGKTTFVVPVGEELVFQGKTASTLKQITDGTSNTIMLVEVEPERAVVWTKPGDWEVDLSDPWRGVRRKDRKWFTTAFCDGSAHILDDKMPAEILRRFLTHAGKEVIDWP